MDMKNIGTQNIYREMSIYAVLGLFVLVFLTYRDYGITHDEEVQNIYGKMLLSYYLSGFYDTTALEYKDLYRYGGLFDLIAAVCNLISPLGEYETRHLLGGLSGIIGFIAAWKLGNLLLNEKAGFVSLVLLAITPVFYAHNFNNPKDGPFASAMLWTLYFSIQILQQLPKPRLSTSLKWGVALGCALSIRITGILAIAELGIVIILYLLLNRLIAKDYWDEIFQQLLQIIIRILPGFILAYAIMIFFWPWAGIELLNPIKALFAFSTLPIDIDVLVGGKWFKAVNIPAYYLSAYLLVNLPEIILVGLIIGIVIAVCWGIKHYKKLSSYTSYLPYFLLFIASLFPIFLTIVMNYTDFNGLRHFLFVVPPLTVLAALSLTKIWDMLENKAFWLGRIFSFIFASLIIIQIWIMARLHPDEYVYFNVLTGGTKGAEGRFEMDYWSNSLSEAVTKLGEYLEQENADNPYNPSFKVAVCGHPLSASYFFPPFLSLTYDLQEADFLIAFTQKDCDEMFKGKPIVTVERFGANLSIVKDRRDLKSENEEDGK